MNISIKYPSHLVFYKQSENKIYNLKNWFERFYTDFVSITAMRYLMLFFFFSFVDGYLSLPELSSDKTESFSLAILTPGRHPHSSKSKSKGDKRRRRLNNVASHTPDKKQHPKLVFNLKNSFTAKYNDSKNKISNHERKHSSWRRSRKTRRHEKSNAFHSHHRHYTQEVILNKEPTFDKSSPSMVSAQIGSNAFLTCKIYDLQDKSVRTTL